MVGTRVAQVTSSRLQMSMKRVRSKRSMKELAHAFIAVTKHITPSPMWNIGATCM